LQRSDADANRARRNDLPNTGTAQHRDLVTGSLVEDGRATGHAAILTHLGAPLSQFFSRGGNAPHGGRRDG
jgi:hypothetical protein